jgi:hypothetical protein
MLEAQLQEAHDAAAEPTLGAFPTDAAGPTDRAAGRAGSPGGRRMSVMGFLLAIVTVLVLYIIGYQITTRRRRR